MFVYLFVCLFSLFILHWRTLEQLIFYGLTYWLFKTPKLPWRSTEEQKPNLNFVCIFNISASIKTAKYASWGKTNLVRRNSQFRGKARNSRQGNRRTQSRVSQWYPEFENLRGGGSGGGALSTYTLEIKVHSNFSWKSCSKVQWGRTSATHRQTPRIQWNQGCWTAPHW